MWRRLRRKPPREHGRSNASVSAEAPVEDPPRSRTLSVASRSRALSVVSNISEDVARERSPFSSFRGPSPGPEHNVADVLGLQIVYQPPSEAPVDIVFVHGLGGASRKTWSKNQDPKAFWPELWLPLEPEICQARILTFGYNANFRYGSANSIANIADFAKDLLFDMKFGKDHNAEDLRLGRVPILFVVHSMGGLVAKKAYLLGQNDENYQGIVKSISAMIFLATPHRGTSLADLLNKILSVSFQYPKNFIVDLNKSSATLEELNEQFRHVATRLSIISFYETFQTFVGPKSFLILGQMVLEKDSSILGYPGEISKSLNADHHDVCKFTSQDDPNYVSVRNAIKTLVEKFRSTGTDVLDTRLKDEVTNVQQLLGFAENPDDDFAFFQQRRTCGTCQWVLSETKFMLWLEPKHEPCITWLSAPPASGKSILATYIIEHVQNLGRSCQYFYFRFGDQFKRSVTALLRSIGVQMSRQIPAFRKALTDLSREGVKLDRADSRTIWQKVFMSALSHTKLSIPLYWVIDALDESDSPRSFLDLLQTLSAGGLPIRILILSRNMDSLSQAFTRLSASAPVNVIEKMNENHVASDIELYVRQEIQYVRGSEELRTQIIQKILRNANGNFLWVHLVLEELCSCHTQQAIQQTLEDVPPGMEALYQRMDLALTKTLKQSDRILARTLISWTICAQRPLSLKELSQALLPDFPEFLDLKSTIQHVCGHFVVVDQTSHVGMVHQSARDYLTRTPGLQLSIDLKASHRDLLTKNITVRGAQSLTSFVGLERKLNAEKSPLLHRLQDLDLLESWATDLLKIVGKFGRRLRQHPTAIYNLVPPFCPSGSNMHRQFSHSRMSELSVSGITNIQWDDCLARIMLPNGAKAWNIMCAGRYLAVSSSEGSILLGDSTVFEKICTLLHGEHITTMCFNTRCDRLVSCGVRTTKMWAIPDGGLLRSIPNPPNAKAMAVVFTSNDTRIMTASDDKSIRSVYISNIEGGWQCPDPDLLRETIPVEGGLITSPCYMAFGPDAAHVAVAYRGYPLSVWSTTEPRLIGRCKRISDLRPNHARPSVSWSAVDRLSWNSVTGHVVGLYIDGSIFKWHPIRDETQEARITADEIEVSPDGKLFITSDSNGTVRVWNFTFFSVIYQLSSEDLVSGLAFGPECTRFYDLRGSSINVWEPNSLVRLSDGEESTSETASESQTLASASQASEASVSSVDRICALAAADKSSLYCAANEDGIVNLYDSLKGKLQELMRSLNFLAVNHIAWSEDAKYVATADFGGNITVKCPNPSHPEGLKGGSQVLSVFSAKPKAEFGGIRQLLLNQYSNKLLVIGRESSQIWSVETERVESTYNIHDGESGFWINHPLQKDLLIGVGPDVLAVLRWEKLAEVSRFRVRRNASSLEAEEAQRRPATQSAFTSPEPYQSNSFVSKAILTQDAEHIMVQISRISIQGRSIKDVVVLKVSSLEQPSDDMTLNAVPIPLTILSSIAVPLGILSGGRLVFLDHDLWMCTFRLYSGDVKGSKRHFFIPRDWASADALEQCCLMNDGTFLLPKGGEVAVISSGLGSADW